MIRALSIWVLAVVTVGTAVAWCQDVHPGIRPGLVILTCGIIYGWVVINYTSESAVRQRRRRLGQCESCGYDLADTPDGVCPECGADCVEVSSS